MADVVIVGGGVIGCSVAFHLARAGVTGVVLLERATLASGVTGICPGGIRQQFDGEADCLLAQRSVVFYDHIDEILEPEHRFAFEKSGYLFLADSDAVLEKFRRNVAMQNRLGIPSEILTAADISQLLPAINTEGLSGGAFCREDGFIEDCHGVAFALARRARDLGVRVIHEDARSFLRQDRGWAVVTSQSSFQAQHVVLAAGVDSVPLAAGAGVPLPIKAERRRLLYSTPTTSGQMNPLVAAPERGFAGKQLTSGVFYMGWLRETPADADLTFIEKTLEAGSTLLPLLAELPARRVLGGLYDSTPDHRPLLGPVPGVEGLHLAVGFSGHGFMIAPAVGEIVAAGIVGTATDLPAAAFSLERFSTTIVDEGLVI
ncbi:MAG: FAD-binding oxidoreductase [Acidobacteria bacterium]|nr:FAD-binding oxidoreductase [Acidobacteriota bacterium]